MQNYIIFSINVCVLPKKYYEIEYEYKKMEDFNVSSNKEYPNRQKNSITCLLKDKQFQGFSHNLGAKNNLLILTFRFFQEKTA